MIKNLVDKYKFVLFAIVVITSWGVVPLCADLGSLPGGQTTMWVNIFASIAVFAFMYFGKKFKEFDKSFSYAKYAGVGIVWPLAYSILYFSAVDLGGPSLTTITNYTWPIFSVLLLTIFYRQKRNVTQWGVVILAVLGVAIPLFAEGTFRILLFPAALGIFAAMTQSLYHTLSKNFPDDKAWAITLVVSVITAIGSAIYVAIFEEFSIPSLQTFFYLLIIGAVSNGLGFWAFLRGSQLATKGNEHNHTIFILMMCLTPLIQVVLVGIPIFHLESVSYSRWIGVALILASLIIYQLSRIKLNSQTS